MLAWIILITENILLFSGLLIWLNRQCQKCQKVKCIERIFNQTCRTCYDRAKTPNQSKNSRSKKNGEIPL